MLLFYDMYVCKNASSFVSFSETIIYFGYTEEKKDASVLLVRTFPVATVLFQPSCMSASFFSNIVVYKHNSISEQAHLLKWKLLFNPLVLCFIYFY